MGEQPPKSGATRYRDCVARIAGLALDRWDLMFCAHGLRRRTEALDGYRYADLTGVHTTRQTSRGGYIPRGDHVARAGCETQRTIRPELPGYVRCADAFGVTKRFGFEKHRLTDNIMLWVQKVHDDVGLACTKEIGYDSETT